MKGDTDLGLTIALYVFILLVAGLVDLRVLLKDGSIKIWILYGGLTAFGVALMIVSVTVGHAVNVYAPIETALHPVSQWVFQTS